MCFYISSWINLTGVILLLFIFILFLFFSLTMLSYVVIPIISKGVIEKSWMTSNLWLLNMEWKTSKATVWPEVSQSTYCMYFLGRHYFLGKFTCKCLWMERRAWTIYFFRVGESTISYVWGWVEKLSMINF